MANAEGVTYDEETGTLTIETWGPAWGDLSMALLRHDESITCIAASRVNGGRVEDGFRGIERIVIRRPGGDESPVEGERAT